MKKILFINSVKSWGNSFLKAILAPSSKSWLYDIFTLIGENQKLNFNQEMKHQIHYCYWNTFLVGFSLFSVKGFASSTWMETIIVSKGCLHFKDTQLIVTLCRSGQYWRWFVRRYRCWWGQSNMKELPGTSFTRWLLVVERLQNSLGLGLTFLIYSWFGFNGFGTFSNLLGLGSLGLWKFFGFGSGFWV